MPSFEPFTGIRYDLAGSDPATVTAPPYDVIDPEQRAALAALDPHNVVRIDMPEDGDDPYDAAGAAFASWQAEGVLVTDQPSFYVYRMDTTDETGTSRHTTGVIGALELSRPGEGGILPHEHTTPKAKSDRLNLLRGARANLSAVWALSPAPGLTGLLETGEDPIATWADGEGTVHSLWIVDDPDRMAKISDTVAAQPVVIADGHHRFETSLAYRDEQRDAAGQETGPAEAVMTYVVELAEEQLTVLPIHRLISGLPADLDLRAALDPFFVVTPAGPVDPGIVPTMVSQGFLVLVEPGRTSLLTPRPEAMVGFRDLDSVRLDAALATLPAHDLVFQHGVDNVVRAVERGDAQAGVLLAARHGEADHDIAHGGERMPPKTTFFHPKPRTGRGVPLTRRLNRGPSRAPPPDGSPRTP